MPHLLYVAWGFSPSRGAGTYRAVATANRFAAAGWRVTVLTADRRSLELTTGIDSAVDELVDPRVTVRRIPFDAARFDTDLAAWPRLRAFWPLGWSGARLLHENRHFPESGYGHWAPSLRRAALAIHEESPVDLAIGTSNPHVDFVPGATLAKADGVPYILDFRDTWHLDVYRSKRTQPRTARSSRAERRLIADATEIWYVNEPIADWHRREFPEHADRMHVVMNGWDISALPREARPVAGDAPFTLGYLGTIYGPMPMREVLDGWRAAVAAGRVPAGSRFEFWGRLGHYGTADTTLAHLLDSYADVGVRYHGPVAKTSVRSVYDRFDALALILGESEYVTSGKVFEYAATGLPIVSLQHPRTASSAVLQDHPMTHPAREVSAAEFEAAIARVAQSAATWSPDDRVSARQWAMKYERAQQLDDVLSRISGIMKAE